MLPEAVHILTTVQSHLEQTTGRIASAAQIVGSLVCPYLIKLERVSEEFGTRKPFGNFSYLTH
ncbi:hypothetical protein NECAME_14747 [Necator americanus]|uniref:Uncharacterized protein n=1 Tax=Necator americanus TaxID=51031 RepID=W2SLA2_NECAM|nr:hypothetical protein NECAME_14747 [Necator americanus]ETN70449.1 hypothetical protein NECAME_14747 [Necator americanus]